MTMTRTDRVMIWCEMRWDDEMRERERETERERKRMRRLMLLSCC